MKTPRRVTAAQVKELRRQLNQGASLRRAAMTANMDRKSARKYRNLGQLPDEARRPRTWRTWPDALAKVWPAVAEQLQREPRLQAKTLWSWLQQGKSKGGNQRGQRNLRPGRAYPRLGCMSR